MTGMNALVLMGSPRRNGNTAALLAPFCAEKSNAEAGRPPLLLYLFYFCSSTGGTMEA